MVFMYTNTKGRRLKYYTSISTNMPKVPENIRNSFLKVKDRFDGTLVLRNINGHFSVYRAVSSTHIFPIIAI